MNNNFVQVAKNLLDSLLSTQESYEPRYDFGWKVCRHGGYEAFEIVRNYPKVSDLKLIYEALKSLEVTDQYIKEALGISQRVFEIIIELFEENDCVLISKDDKDSYHNYMYYVNRYRQFGDVRTLLDDPKMYPIAGDHYGSDCIRLATVNTVKHVKEYFPRYLAEKMEKDRQEKVNRIEKFQETSNAVGQKYGKKILKLVLRNKGSVLAILKLLNKNTMELDSIELEKIIRLSSSAPVIGNLIICVANKLDVFKAAKVSSKAYAWRYLDNSFPGVIFKGYFNSAKEALEIYSKNWGYKNIPAEFTLGEILEKK